MALTMHAANMLGLDYRLEAQRLPWREPIWDAHVHINDLAMGRVFFEVASWFGMQHVVAQVPLEQVDALQGEFGSRLTLVAVPNYAAKDQDETFTTDYYRRMEAYRQKGARLAKFWSAPRGLDFHPSFRLDHPQRIEAMRVARSLGFILMVHVADPDTWFATMYKDAAKYGTKAEHHARLERVLDEFADTPVLAAHMAGHPEDLGHLHELLTRYPNLYIDTSATKWMVRELSKHAREDLAALLRAFPGRILFGTDIVVNAKDDPATVHDLYASRFWAMRTLMETAYDGPSPIVDPDLHKVDPAQPENATARLRGAALSPEILQVLYHDATRRFLALTGKPESR